FRASDTNFELAAHRAMDVHVELASESPVSASKPEPSAPAPTQPASAEPVPHDQPEAPAKHGVGAPTWIAFGVGAAALGGALAFELMRAQAEDDVKSERRQVDRLDAYDRMQSRQKTARILAGVGAVGIVTGGVLLYFDLSSSSAKQSSSAALGFGRDQ